ncbi:hypothetical protein PAXRUDRAFT_256837 [Paxillus rubicundulus Ve08.2h10]|uniref:Uncharacterized protein n=1 Tax=Paxillus rubicundulus Ve08.2h10 TaxID=930991 RepID=A0A0D0E0R1_9AGAM|nr:hypothetical protein PAXRUDRAFT_256837 [Paxillus rubicundulus Ve08.2h10]
MELSSRAPVTKAATTTCLRVQRKWGQLSGVTLPQSYQQTSAFVHVKIHQQSQVLSMTIHWSVRLSANQQ